MTLPRAAVQTARSATGNRVGSSGCRTARTTAVPDVAAAGAVAGAGTAAAVAAALSTGNAAAVGSWPR